MRVPFLPKTDIIAAADALIDHYERRTGEMVTGPVPVMEMLEDDLGLTVAFEDPADTSYMRDGVLGATFVPERKVAINTNLLEARYEGRMQFTGAHEAGHWVLHRQYARAAARLGEGVILCRVASRKAPIEWQADFFAGCLLMPERLVRHAFEATFNADHLDLHNVDPVFNDPFCFDPCLRTWPRIAEAVCRVGNFINVSKQAMIVRLQELGMVRNHTGIRPGWGTLGLA